MIPVERIEGAIFEVRGQKVMLDVDLADLYGVGTGALVRAVMRNLDRFPADFQFRLTPGEFDSLRCQIGISKGRGGRRYLPYVFTEHGAVMLAAVLKSKRAVEVSVFVVKPSCACAGCWPDSESLRSNWQNSKASSRSTTRTSKSSSTPSAGSWRSPSSTRSRRAKSVSMSATTRRSTLPVRGQRRPDPAVLTRRLHQFRRLRRFPSCRAKRYCKRLCSAPYG